MNDQSISRYPVPKLEDLADDIRERMLTVQETPAEFRAFFAYHDAIMEREESTLTPAEKEMIIVATSSENNCQYCVVAHGALLRIFSKDPLLADKIAINYLHAPLNERQKLMLKFALKLSRTPELVAEADFAELRQQGYTEDDILDISGITAFFGLSNRMAIVMSMQANTEFYTMAR